MRYRASILRQPLCRCLPFDYDCVAIVLCTSWLLIRCHFIRVLEISDQVRQVLNQPNSQCTIAPAPADSAEADSAVALAKRCLCKVSAPGPLSTSLAEWCSFRGYKLCGSIIAVAAAGVALEQTQRSGYPLIREGRAILLHA